MTHTSLTITGAAALAAATLLLASCRSHAAGTAEPPALAEAGPGAAATAPAVEPGAKALPRAQIYRTDGDYADCVPVTIDAAGALTSFPAPGDLTAESAPVALADGWLYDRRGISPHTAFTRYTYAAYRALPAAPGVEQLKEAVIPGARVTEIARLPMPIGTPCDTALVNTLIRTGKIERIWP